MTARSAGHGRRSEHPLPRGQRRALRARLVAFQPARKPGPANRAPSSRRAPLPRGLRGLHRARPRLRVALGSARRRLAQRGDRTRRQAPAPSCATRTPRRDARVRGHHRLPAARPRRTTCALAALGLARRHRLERAGRPAVRPASRKVEAGLEDRVQPTERLELWELRSLAVLPQGARGAEPPRAQRPRAQRRKRGRRRPALVAKGGKMQVPYLVDPNTGAALYESDDIVAYLHTTYGVTAT